jgi:hypothetical protein
MVFTGLAAAAFRRFSARHGRTTAVLALAVALFSRYRLFAQFYGVLRPDNNFLLSATSRRSASA